MGVIDMFNDFVKLIESESLPVEAVAIADGDAIIAERHFVPDQDRNIYSHTKSYVSTAIGIAIEDGLLSLDSRLVDSFPEYVPSDAQLELGQITLRHLLTMSSGFNHAYLMNPDRRSGVGAPDYLRYMFSRRLRWSPAARSAIRLRILIWRAACWSRLPACVLASICMARFFPSWIRVGLFGNVIRKVIRLQAAGSTCRLQIC